MTPAGCLVWNENFTFSGTSSSFFAEMNQSVRLLDTASMLNSFSLENRIIIFPFFSTESNLFERLTRSSFTRSVIKWRFTLAQEDACKSSLMTLRMDLSEMLASTASFLMDRTGLRAIFARTDFTTFEVRAIHGLPLPGFRGLEASCRNFLTR